MALKGQLYFIQRKSVILSAVERNIDKYTEVTKLIYSICDANCGPLLPTDVIDYWEQRCKFNTRFHVDLAYNDRVVLGSSM